MTLTDLPPPEPRLAAHPQILRDALREADRVDVSSRLARFGLPGRCG